MTFFSEKSDKDECVCGVDDLENRKKINIWASKEKFDILDSDAKNLIHINATNKPIIEKGPDLKNVTNDHRIVNSYTPRRRPWMVFIKIRKRNERGKIKMFKVN